MARRLTLRYRDRDHLAEIIDPTHVRVDGASLEVAHEGNGVVRFVNGPTGSAYAVADGDTRWVFYDGRVYELEVTNAARPRRASHHGSLSAPMPATVRKILVAPGARVTRGDIVVVLEAMKMELPVRAPADGVVTAIRCREGDLVQPGVPLIEVS